MAFPSLHILPFTLLNPYSLSFDPSGPFPTLFRLLTVTAPSIRTLNLSQYAGRTILITGATSGCGLDCAKAFASVGCRLILTARNEARGEDAKQQVFSEARSADAKTMVDVVPLDMTSSASVQTFPSRLRQLVQHLDIAILNAGVYRTDFSLCTETGFEAMSQVNILSTAALTLSLRPFLHSAESGCLLVVSSEAHAWANPQHHSARELLEAMKTPKAYPCYQRYHISKLLLILWMRELSRRKEYSDISVAAVSPGFTRSQLFRDFNSLAISRALERAVCRSSEQGAGQYVLALDAMACGRGKGEFWSDAGWRRLVFDSFF